MHKVATTTYKFVGVAKALSPIHQGGEGSGGTIDLINREKHLLENGDIIELPTITGNGVRGPLRRSGAKAMLESLGSPILPVGVFHFLTSGGALTKEAGRGLDIDEERTLRTLVPHGSVFGGATGRRILRSKLKVGIWVPICQETCHILPEYQRGYPHAQQSIFDMVQLLPRSRHDEAKDVYWQQYLSEPDRVLLAAPKQKVGKDGTEVAEKAGTAQQMRFRKEALATGTLFSCWFQLDDVTPLEFEAFGTALMEWSKTPFIGGDSREGLGMVSLLFDNWYSVNPLAAPSKSQAVALPHGVAYREHLHENEQAIITHLRGMD